MLGQLGPVWMVGMIVLVPTLLATFVAVLGVQMLRQAQASMVRMRDKALIIEQKLDVIHDITNSRLKCIEDELLLTKGQLASALALQAGPRDGEAG